MTYAWTLNEQARPDSLPDSDNAHSKRQIQQPILLTT
jgi:hypothetical protein